MLRTYPKFIVVSESGADQDELWVMLDDPDRSREELVDMMLHGVGKPGDWLRSIDAFADRAAALRDDGAALKTLRRRVLDGQGGRRARACAEIPGRIQGHGDDDARGRHRQDCPGHAGGPELAATAGHAPQFDHFLDHICRETDLTPAAKKVNVLSASRVIMDVVRDKYRRRLQTLLDSDVDAPGRGNGCPIVDATLAPYFPVWDETALGPMAVPQPQPQQPPGPADHAAKVSYDLWATMTIDWVNEAMLAGNQ